MRTIEEIKNKDNFLRMVTAGDQATEQGFINGKFEITSVETAFATLNKVRIDKITLLGKLASQEDNAMFLNIYSDDPLQSSFSQELSERLTHVFKLIPVNKGALRLISLPGQINSSDNISILFDNERAAVQGAAKLASLRNYAVEKMIPIDKKIRALEEDRSKITRDVESKILKLIKRLGEPQKEQGR